MPRPEAPPRLAAMQTRFVAALLADRDAVPPEIAGPNAAPPVKRFHVYRNNVFASLIGALRARFPAVERLVGEAFFQATARVFVETHPPRSPALFEYGAEFAAFLAVFEPARELPYLPDVTRLEWLRCEAYHAADAAPVAAEALSRIPAEALAGLRLRLHPSARLFRSDWPAVSIWEINRDEAAAATLDGEAGAEDALIVRPHLDVQILRLGPGGHAFTRTLAEGTPLGAAADRAAAEVAAFSLPQALGALLAAGAFSEISLTPTAWSTTS